MIRLLDGDCSIEANCNICGEVWTLSDEDRARLDDSLAIFR